MPTRLCNATLGVLAIALLSGPPAARAEDWPQLKFDSGHSGNVPDRHVAAPLGLAGAVPLTDAVLTSPAVANGRAYVVDAAGTAFCIDAETFRVVWKFTARGGAANCNNTSSPSLLNLSGP